MNEYVMYEELIQIIEQYCSIDKTLITLETDIFRDIGCSGDDAWELMEVICKKYNINCKEFNPSDIFDTEGNNYFKSILNPVYLYKKIFDKEKVKIPIFTVEMLLLAINTKTLRSIREKGYYYANKIEYF